jgi:hypothetical protein
MAVESIGRLEIRLESFMCEMEHRETSEGAYFRWLNGGRELGHDLEDWFDAEGMLRGK